VLTGLPQGGNSRGRVHFFRTRRLGPGPLFSEHAKSGPGTISARAGKGGTTPALGVVVNAVVDALSEYGVRHVEMPATPERIWRAIHEAQASNR